MSAARDDEIIAEAVERTHEVLHRAADEVDRIRREVFEATGVELVEQSPKALAVMDVPMSTLAQVAEQCRSLLAGVELLQPHVTRDSDRTVGSVVKTRVSLSDAAMAIHFLNRSEFFAPSEFCDGPEAGS
ncbi:hypothetical protein [Streptomyces chartreusis]|uniref:hypothetical protein n=1 Tax=Streptomyces chartreusis TaxID=1969 RepID=UPI00362EC30E